MFTAQFTEFSYGYAITDNLLHSGLPYSPHTPVFPSLAAEGALGGGYDVRIPLRPVAIFLQFKIPQIVWRRSFNMPTGFSTPYLRMHLRTRRPDQHQLLLDLESGEPLVFYATPDFWSVAQLDRHFTAQEVHKHSRFIRPSQIGALDARAHHVAFRPGYTDAWVRSEPFRLEGGGGAKHFGASINQAVKGAKKQEPDAFLRGIASRVARITWREGPLPVFPDSITADAPSEEPKVLAARGSLEARKRFETRRLMTLAREVAYASQVRLGCTLVITGVD